MTLPSTAGPSQAFSTVITPRRGLFDWRLHELWHYRDLIGLFVWRDFVSVYKQTVLGPAWHVFRPLLTTVVFTLVFGGVAKLSTDGAPPFLFYMSGTIIWAYFASCLENITRTFLGNMNLLSKVYFHRLSIPISLILSNLVAFAIQFGIFLLTLAVFIAAGSPVRPTAWALTIPLLLTVLAGYGLGVGLMCCAATTRFRDLAYLVAFGIQLLMYLTPVIYPVAAVPPRFRWVAELNPLTPIIESFRLGLLGVGTVDPWSLVTSTLVMMIFLVAGLVLFARAERTVIDTI